MLFDMDALSTNNDIMAYHNTYHADEKNTTIQDAKEELVNDVTARLFFAEGGIEEAVKYVQESKNMSVEEKQNFFDTLKNIINHIVDVISKHVTNRGLRASEKAVADMSLDDIKKLRQQFLEVIYGAISNLENGVEIESEIKWQKDTSEKNSLRDQIKGNLDEINEMKPVYEISYAGESKREARLKAIADFKQFGYHIDRQNFGRIELGVKQISEGASYMNTPAEIAALQAVPRVLKRGKLIDYHTKHKGESRNSATFAAPVVINGVRGNMAVAVKISGKNKYHAHRILMPDGTEFIIKYKDSEFTGTDMKSSNANQGPVINSKSTNTIPQNAEKSNTKKSLDVEDLRERRTQLQSEENKAREEVQRITNSQEYKDVIAAFTQVN